MKQEVLIGQTDYSVLVKIRDDAGAPATGLDEGDIDIAYARVETDNDVTTSDVTPAALSALTDAHTDWGFEEVSATDHPGLYRLDIADAVFASGAWSAVVTITGTGLDPCDLEFVLVAFNPRDGVRLGLTALPNAAADAAGGLPISDAGGLDLDAQLVTKINDILTDTGTTLDGRIPAALVGGRMDSTIDGTGMENGAVDAILNRDASGSTTNSTLGAIINDWENGGRLDLIIDNVNTLVAGNDTYLSGLNSRIPAALTADGNMKADALRINGQLTSAAATVTFPATIASTTNITAGTITTVTNLTNAPTSGDLTSTMKDSVETAVTTALGGTDVTDFTAIPSGTPNVLEALGFLYAQGFYRKEQTATTTTLYDGDNNAVAEATTSDNGTTFVRTRFSAP